MSTRQIVFHPHPILRVKAEPVSKFDPALRELAKEMLATMKEAGGVGLAGPQVGLAQRLFVMRVSPDDGRLPEGERLAGRELVLINPEIIEASEELAEGIEACLSIPGYAGLVPRHTRLVVRARNEWGKSTRYVVEGFLARVMQHEMDHLDGILFLDRLTGEDKLFKVTEGETEKAEGTLSES